MGNRFRFSPFRSGSQDYAQRNSSGVGAASLIKGGNAPPRRAGGSQRAGPMHAFPLPGLLARSSRASSVLVHVVITSVMPAAFSPSRRSYFHQKFRCQPDDGGRTRLDLLSTTRDSQVTRRYTATERALSSVSRPDAAGSVSSETEKHRARSLGLRFISLDVPPTPHLDRQITLRVQKTALEQGK